MGPVTPRRERSTEGRAALRCIPLMLTMHYILLPAYIVYILLHLRWDDGVDTLFNCALQYFTTSGEGASL